MILKCFINGKEYKIVQGATFAEEYNETLDSGTIIITHVEKIEDLKPYDDVFIYEGEFKGYGENIVYDGFYKHLLVDQYNEERLNPVENIYSYKIQLFSETKKLETIQLPNISITQPLDINKKKTVFNYLDSFVDLYSPVKKVAVNDEMWFYQQKYTLDQSLSAVFSDIYAPDFTLNAPSLKDLIAQLMLTRDKIPYVKDDVIYALDITERKKDFDLNGVTSITGSMTSDDYCNNLKRNYSNALTQDFSCNMIEYLGFRNSDTPLLTLENLRLETSFPIYKINKIYLCYYKKMDVYEVSDTDFESPLENKTKAFLCKQDITPLVLLNETRNLLSQDWDEFGDTVPESIEDLASYKLATLGYDIGSKYIGGWGTKYDFPVGFWKTDERTYIENVVAWMDNKYPFGIYGENYLTDLLEDDEVFLVKSFDSLEIDSFLNNVLPPKYEDKNGNKTEITGPAKMKFLFFQVEYDAFYNGAIVHSKDNLLDDITINDNSSASLTLIDKDGLFQKEKINRFGNKGYIIKARVNDYKDLNNLGDVYDDDVIIYHREYQIWDDYILVDYYGTKDYVLKNYFTTVFARYRNYNLMSYNESINRAENKKVFLLLSTNKCYYEDDLDVIQFKNFDNENPIRQLLSFFTPSEKYDIKGLYKTPQKINYGYYTYDGDYFASDINTFTSGNSLCINLKMYDNVTGGVYIKNPRPSKVNQNVKEDLIGSVQSWHMSANEETGRSEKMGFYCGHVDKNSYFEDKVLNKNEFDEIQNNIYKKLLNLPMLESSDINLINMKNVIGKDYRFLKDNKEIIDMTFQIEALTQNTDVLFSPWLFKLCDLLGIYNKVNKNYEILLGKSNVRYNSSLATTSYKGNIIGGGYGKSLDNYRVNIFTITIDSEDYNQLIGSEENIFLANFNLFLEKDNTIKANTPRPIADPRITYYAFKGEKMTDVKETSFKIIGDEFLNYQYYNLGQQVGNYVPDNKPNYTNQDRVIIFEKISESDGKIVFSNFRILNDYKYVAIPGNELYINDSGKKLIVYNCDAIEKDDGKANFDFIINKKTNTDNTVLYEKNLFFTVSNEEMKKTIIYEELKDLSQKDGLEIYSDNISPIELASDKNNLPILKINCISQQIQDKKNFSVWYKIDNSYKFVFGVNLKEELKIYGDGDYVEESIKIYYEFADNDYNSDSGMYTRIFEYFIPGAIPEGYDYGPHLTCNVEGQESLVSSFNFSAKTNIVNFTLTSKDKIAFDAQLNYISRDVYIPIYLSLVSNRDTRVYDMNNKKVGNNFNYTELLNNQPEETDVFWGELQYFKKDTDDDIYYESKGLSYNLNSENKYVVKGIGNCKDKYILIPKKHKEIDVVSIDNNAFENSDLYYIEIPENIIDIGESAFKNSIYLKKIKLPDSVTVLEKSIFENCASLKNIKINETLTEIKDYAFKDCIKLSDMEIPKSVESIGKKIFENCINLERISIPFLGESKEDTENSFLGYLFGASSADYNMTDIPSKLQDIEITNSETIYKSCFLNCKNLRTITLSNTVKKIEESAFSGCSNLTTVNLFDGLEEIGKNAFATCFDLSTIKIPDTVSTIGVSAFLSCYNLKTIIIPKNVTTIGASAFQLCSGLTIYCEASEKPEGWSTNWNSSNRPVTWGYTPE